MQDGEKIFQILSIFLFTSPLRNDIIFKYFGSIDATR